VYRFFGRDRETVADAYAGDVVGLVSASQLAIGDTLYADVPVRFPPVPAFSPERFATLRPEDGGHKHFRRAVHQLGEEGLMQIFTRENSSPQPIIGVVGALQFDVVQARLAAEYGIVCMIDPLSYIAARWPIPRHDAAPALDLRYSRALLVSDQRGLDALLFPTDFSVQDCVEHNPAWRFLESR
jgi:peptide chain release factor 3